MLSKFLYWSCASSIAFPVELVQQTRKRLLFLCEQSSSYSIIGSFHMGGVFDSHTKNVIEEFLQQSSVAKKKSVQDKMALFMQYARGDIAKIKANMIELFDHILQSVLVATEISTRIAMGMLLSDSHMRHQTSILVYLLILRGRLFTESIERMIQVANVVLSSAPICQDLYGIHGALQVEVLDYWVKQCLQPQLSGARNSSSDFSISNLSISNAVEKDLGVVWYSVMVRWTEMGLGNPMELVAMQSVVEILSRHIKASGKRLRADQITNISIEMPSFLQSASRDRSTHRMLAHWISRYIQTHDWKECVAFSVDVQTSQLLQQTEQKIHIQYSTDATKEYLLHMIGQLQGVFAGVSSVEIAQMGQLPLHSVQQYWNNPLRKIVEQLRYASNQISQSQMDKFQYNIPTKVIVYTNRGGKWPENRKHIVYTV